MIPLGPIPLPISLASIASAIGGAIAAVVVLILIFSIGFRLVRWLWPRVVGLASDARPVVGLYSDVQRARRRR